MADERLSDEDLSEVERHLHPHLVWQLLAEVRASRELLAKLEWAADGEFGKYCPSCQAWADGDPSIGKPSLSHWPGCALARLLGREPKG